MFESSTELRLFTMHTGTESTVELGGDLDLAVVQTLVRHLDALIDDGTKVLTIDMARVEFCDSTTLGVLVGAHRRMRLRNGQLRIINPAPRAVQLLRISGLEGLVAQP